VLKHLRISNFAILSDVEMELAPGFNVFTGETGAGKSLIVDAVALLRGGRASADIPRAGADEAVVEAVFEAPDDLRGAVEGRLSQAGLRVEEEVLVRRVISRGGRSRIHVNGGLSTAAALAEIGALLVDLAGQHEHQGLVDAARHAEILDRFGVDRELSSRAESAYERLRAAMQALCGASQDERTRADREDFLRFQIGEIDAAALRAGEETELLAERERLRFGEKLLSLANRGEEVLYSREDAVVDRLAGLLKEMTPLVTVDPRLEEPQRQLAEAHILCADAATRLGRYAQTVSNDPERLSQVEDKLHLISRLARKHGPTTADILARRDALAQELESLEAHESRRAALDKEVDDARALAAERAESLSAARRKAALRLEKEASQAVAALGMKGARVTVSIEPRLAQGGEGELVASGRRLSPHGWDRVELLLSANAGEEPRPLAKIASGGELSRIMLALKLSLQKADAVATYVFDEVDAGIGGATAEVVGRQIQRVSAGRQVLCVTHLAQIAALADAHFRVEKFAKAGRTETLVTRLPLAERREEIARMLGGLKITPRTRAHAEEMLRQSR
jgi:DNA repair protein RecN (Recombination protein N)